MLRTVSLIVASLVFGSPLLAAEAPRQVVLHQHGHGWTLTDDKGMTLYTYEKDVDPGKSNCVGACARQWPALAVTSDEDRAGGDWSMVVREDKSRQWAFQGKPLYLYKNDAKPGDANGDGVANQWNIAFKPVSTPPGIGVQRTLVGYVLIDQKKMTLYALDKDKADGSGCDGVCTQNWSPMWAPTVAHGFGDWSVLTRKDGSRQWAFKGKPIYRYKHDAHPAEISGETAGKGWHAVVLEPPPPDPSWVTVQTSDQGELLADAQARTLYLFDFAARQLPTGNTLIPKFDNPDDWIPLLAAADAKAVGYWSIIEREGKMQWAYKGLPIYLNKNDKAPGDLFGARGGGRARLRPILRPGFGVG